MKRLVSHLLTIAFNSPSMYQVLFGIALLSSLVATDPIVPSASDNPLMNGAKHWRAGQCRVVPKSVFCCKWVRMVWYKRVSCSRTCVL